MKKMIYIILSSVLITSGFSGCRSTNNEEKNSVVESTKAPEIKKLTLSELQNDLNEQRKKELTEPMKHTAEEFGILGKEDTEDFSESEIEELVKKHQYKRLITKEEALQDIETLMKILKTSYGAYNYFGGDDRFDEAKQQMIQRVQETFDDESTSTGNFVNLILEELSFVEDSHFMIGGQNTKFKKKSLFYDSNKRDFSKDEKGYFTTINNENWYLSLEDESYLHLTVSESGELVYGLFAMAEEESVLPKKFTLTSDGGNEDTMDVVWTITDAGQPENNRIVHSSYEKDGIPVTSLTGMSLSGKDIAMTNEFINQAKQLRDDKVFILDLRQNHGGMIDVNAFFLYNLTGSHCGLKLQTAKRYSLLNLHHEAVVYETVGGNDGYNGFPGVDFYDENKDLVDSWHKDQKDGSDAEVGETVITDYDPQWIDYNNTVIVLIDHNTVSAGEYFLYELSTVKNVIIMGTNSSGCMLTGDVNALSNVYLPNSGIAVNYGQALAITNQMDGYDVNGWMPDIVTRGNALDAAVSLAKKNF